MGHEGVGEVVEVGSRVRHRRVGQRVAIEPNYCCLRCDACRRGLTSACPHRRSVGLTVHGLIAEHVAVPAPFAHPVADEVSLEDLVDRVARRERPACERRQSTGRAEPGTEAPYAR